jgi:hypothetical protein
MHQMAESLFSARERRLLAAVAETAMPAGSIFPGASEPAVGRLEAFMAPMGGMLAKGYKALLIAIDAASVIRFGQRFEDLLPDDRLSILESWRTGDYARRTALRALVSPLKVSHYNDPNFYRAVGCVYETPTAKPETARWMKERVHSGAEVAGETLECDVVVIGTGAGGAVAARELTEKGLAVVMLEEGEWYGRADFNGRPVDMQKKMFRDMGATFAYGNVTIPIPVGRAVGGTTAINSGTCYRVPERVLATWRENHGLANFSSEMLDPYYTRVEGVLGVAEAKAEYLGNVARLIGEGCDRLGWKHKPLRRNAPDCDGQGLCCFGCPTDAKRSTNVSYVPLALKAGATLIKGVKAEKVIVERGRAVGVEAKAHGKTVTVRGRAVVVACGSLLTPIFLGAQGLANSSGELGKNLSIHPATGVFATFDGKIDGHVGIPQGYSIEEFHDEGILFEGVFAPLEVGAATIPLIGEKFTQTMEAFNRLACFGFMIEDSSRGRVRRGPGGKPLITYFLNDRDTAKVKRGVEILSRVYLAAGAREVLPGVHGWDSIRNEADLGRFRRAKMSARDFDLSAYHPLGTARMGIDPKRSVVDIEQQVHDLPGLYVMDGSAVPSSLAVNPQLTIMALATRAAEKLAAKLN